MKHYILTRFNVRFDTKLTKELNAIDVTRNEEYLEERFRLFRKYTFPSLTRQTCRDYQWLVLFSDNTPDRFKEMIKKMQLINSCFVPVFVRDEEDYFDVLEKHIDHNNGVYITSRIDNDDAYALDYVEKVQKTVRRLIQSGNDSKKLVVIFNNGIQFEESTSYAVNYHFLKNHFSTMAISDNTYDTILHYNHNDAYTIGDVEEINNKQPMWLEVVHESNIANRMKISADKVNNTEDLLQRFGVKNVKVKKCSRIYILLYPLKSLCRYYKHNGIKRTVQKAAEKIRRKLRV